MKIHIFDVAHGFCAYVVGDNGNTMLIDCGHNDETGFHPGLYLAAHGCSAINRFFVLNYDEDHLSGLPTLRTLIPIHVLHRNMTITPDQLRILKRQAGPLGAGITALLQIMESYPTGPLTVEPAYPNLEFQFFWNVYPAFADTNNLSLVLFLHYPGLSIVFPGDLEKTGWRNLLQRADFRAHLARVNVFVASHHGRESGYLKEIFDFCKPDIVLISDEEKQYDTQETNYGNHARGIIWNQTSVRKVLTTRKDGMIAIETRGGQGYYIQTSK
jgi:beta-lactamase superfamily II metal-dependent hydrolase